MAVGSSGKFSQRRTRSYLAVAWPEVRLLAWGGEVYSKWKKCLSGATGEFEPQAGAVVPVAQQQPFKATRAFLSSAIDMQTAKIASCKVSSRGFSCMIFASQSLGPG